MVRLGRDSTGLRRLIVTASGGAPRDLPLESEAVLAEFGVAEIA